MCCVILCGTANFSLSYAEFETDFSFELAAGHWAIPLLVMNA